MCDIVTEVSLLSQLLSAELSDSGVPVHLTSLRLSLYCRTLSDTITEVSLLSQPLTADPSDTPPMTVANRL